MFSAVLKIFGLNAVAPPPRKKSKTKPRRRKDVPTRVKPIVTPPPRRIPQYATVHPNSPGAAVRTMTYLAGRGGQTKDAAWFSKPADVLHRRCAEVLGEDVYAYCRALVLTGRPLPAISTDRENVGSANEALMHHLRARLIEDLDTWESALRRLDAQTREETSWLREPPAPLQVPARVKDALKAREEERLKRIGRSGRQGDGAAKPPTEASAEVTVMPTTEPADPPAGPKG